ncbi:substrate-binding periplasmic protein [Niveibacterium sp.]|uniref:substrate-binding periplasmic protein n=1 Tax=Niveibacterium sp. TaxID=2017444 RepID=UPI0035ADFD25
MYRLLAALMLFVATATFADEVRMAFGEKIPPFCFPETNSGIEIEVIAEALAAGGGHRLKPVYYPFARVPVAFKAGEVDAAMTDLGEDMLPHGGHYGDPAVVYDNVFITLRSRGLQIRRPEDLKGLSVIAFQGADKRYPEWLGPVKQAGNYHEQNDQSLQVRMLNEGRHDVVLSDRNIFRYFALQLTQTGSFKPQLIQEHAFTIARPQDYRPVFRSAKVRDDFNAGLALLKKSGRYRAIYDKYLKD